MMVRFARIELGMYRHVNMQTIVLNKKEQHMKIVTAANAPSGDNK